MNPACKELLRRIIGCGLINCQQCQGIYKSQRCKGRGSNICKQCLKSQGCTDIRDFQVPEPWSGDIEKAEILFVGINPGFNSDELYPKLNNSYWIDLNTPGLFDLSKVEDFFENRFDNNRIDPYVKITNPRGKLSFSVRMNNGKYENARGYWNYIQSISDCLLKRPTTPGIDYALTELVHCKSANIRGIKTGCYIKCANSFFNDILSVATNLKYLIVIGLKIKDHVATLLNHCDPNHPTNPGIYDINGNYKCYVTKINGKDVKVLYTPHNAARRKNKGTVTKFPCYNNAGRGTVTNPSITNNAKP